MKWPRWRSYDPEVNRALFEMYADGRFQTRAKLDVWGNSYLIDFHLMIQTSFDTGYVRQIRLV